MKPSEIIANYQDAFVRANNKPAPGITPHGSRGGWYRFAGSRACIRLSAIAAMTSRLRDRADPPAQPDPAKGERQMKEIILEDATRPGIELIHLQGTPGYGDEFLLLSNSLSNGLRFEIRNEIEEDGFDHSGDWMCFHIQSAETAKLIAARLLEWAKRIAEPPAQPDPAKGE